jgi:hypothetical protein
LNQDLIFVLLDQYRGLRSGWYLSCDYSYRIRNWSLAYHIHSRYLENVSCAGLEVLRYLAVYCKC